MFLNSMKYTGIKILRRLDAWTEHLRAEQADTDRFAQLELKDGHHLIWTLTTQDSTTVAAIEQGPQTFVKFSDFNR